MFAENEGILGGAVSASQRRAMLDALGEAASVYRGILYEKVPMPFFFSYLAGEILGVSLTAQTCHINISPMILHQLCRYHLLNIC